LAFFLIFLLSFQAALAAEPELEALRRPVAGHLPDRAETEAAPVRDLAMREAAMGAGVQAGARWRYEKILSEVVLPNAYILDDVFDFGPLVFRKGRLYVIPPVITSSGEAVRVDGDLSAVSQSESFKLIRGARIAAVIPHWRHYLMELPDGPQGLHSTLLPDSSSELGRWRGWVDKGWETGVRRAEELFEENVAALARDYAGMMIFRRLLAESLVAGPVTEESFDSADVSGDEMVFGKRIYRLTETGRFITIGLDERGGRRP
jgi:defect-in-organelle-trafficking protein DotC